MRCDEGESWLHLQRDEMGRTRMKQVQSGGLVSCWLLVARALAQVLHHLVKAHEALCPACGTAVFHVLAQLDNWLVQRIDPDQARGADIRCRGLDRRKATRWQLGSLHRENDGLHDGWLD